MLDDHHGQSGVGDAHRIVVLHIPRLHGIGDRTGEVHFRLSALLLHFAHIHLRAFTHGEGWLELEVVQIGDDVADGATLDGGRVFGHVIELRIVGGVPHQFVIEEFAFVAIHLKSEGGYGGQLRLLVSELFGIVFKAFQRERDIVDILRHEVYQAGSGELSLVIVREHSDAYLVARLHCGQYGDKSLVGGIRGEFGSRGPGHDDAVRGLGEVAPCTISGTEGKAAAHTAWIAHGILHAQDDTVQTVALQTGSFGIHTHAEHAEEMTEGEAFGVPHRCSILIVACQLARG